MTEQSIIVNGIRCVIAPYSEKRYKALRQIHEEIDLYLEKNAERSFDDIMESERKRVAKWWKRKADILWKPERPLDEAFFESDDFEAGQLKDTENFFLANRLYL